MTVQPTRDQLRALANAATEGPWEAYGTTIAAITGPGDCRGCSGLLSPTHEPSCYWSEIAGACEADAEFIAAARNVLPQLLDQLDQAEARMTEEKRLRMKATAAATEAEARIKAVEDVLDLHGPAHDEPGQDEADCGPQIIADIRRALEG